MIDNGRRLFVRLPTPFVEPVMLGAVVHGETMFGLVDGVVLSVTRLPADEWLPAGVLVEIMPLS